jgi:hypothetical protein
MLNLTAVRRLTLWVEGGRKEERKTTKEKVCEMQPNFYFADLNVLVFFPVDMLAAKKLLQHNFAVHGGYTIKKVKGKFKVVPFYTRKTHKGTRNTFLPFLNLAHNGI